MRKARDAAPPPPEAAPTTQTPTPADERLAIARRMNGLADRLNRDSLWLRGPSRRMKDPRLEMAARTMRALAEDLFDVGHELAGGGLALAEAAPEKPTPLLDAIAPKPPPGAKKAKAPKEAEGPEDRPTAGNPMVFGVEAGDCGQPLFKVWARTVGEGEAYVRRRHSPEFRFRMVDLSDPHAAAKFCQAPYINEWKPPEDSNGRDVGEAAGVDAGAGASGRRARRGPRHPRPPDRREAPVVGEGEQPAGAEAVLGAGGLLAEGPAGGQGGRPGGGHGGGAEAVVGAVEVNGGPPAEGPYAVFLRECKDRAVRGPDALGQFLLGALLRPDREQFWYQFSRYPHNDAVIARNLEESLGDMDSPNLIRGPGWIVRGGEHFAFWFGEHSTKGRAPDLEGDALVARVRHLLAIPAPRPPCEDWVGLRLAELLPKDLAGGLALASRIETLGDLQTALRYESLASLRLTVAEADVVREAVAKLRRALGWGPDDGIPEAWLVEEAAEAGA